MSSNATEGTSVEHEHAEKAAAAEHVEHSAGTGRRRSGGGFGSFLRKWWWALLIVGALLVLMVTLLIVYVAFPRIGQQGVDNATLAVLSLSLTNPTETTFHMVQVAQINSTSKYHPFVDPFNASLALAGTAPYTFVTLPGTQSGAEVNVTIDQDVQIADLDAFTAYNVALLGQESIEVVFHGDTHLHEGALPPAAVTYNKTVSMLGFNALKGFAVTDFQLYTTPLANGTNMNGTVYIPNTSVITVELGNVTLNLFLDGNFIGTSSINDLTLRPGNNTVFMTSVVNNGPVLTAVTTNYTDGNLPISIIGNSSVYNGVHLTYFEKALSSQTQQIVLPLCDPLKKLGLALNC